MKTRILGGELDIRDLENYLDNLKDLSYPVQVLRAGVVAGEKHLEFATNKAIESFESNPISDSLSMEILLYVMGTRQISKAIEVAGVSEGKNNVAAVALTEKEEERIAEEINLEINKSVLELKESKIPEIKEVFDITDREIEAVGEDKISKLVRERVALLKLEK